jgi:UMP-CMP kinase
MVVRPAGLLEDAMKHSKVQKFLIDGFPRAMEQVHAWYGVPPKAVLFFDCPEEVMTQRLMDRGQGRADDNPETIAKRLAVFRETSMPVVEWYKARGLVQVFDANRPLQEVAADVDAFITCLEGTEAPAASSMRVRLQL